MKQEIAKRIAGNIRMFRIERGMSQKKLADLLNLSQGNISQWESGRVLPNGGTLASLARVLGVPLDRLTGINDWLSEPRLADHQDNPKPVQVGSTPIMSVFRMLSDTTDGLDLSFRYTHDLRKPPRDFTDAYRNLARLAEQRAQEGGYPHFNGPNTRLIRCSEENTRQLSDGSERKGIVLELGPVSWEEHTVYNCFLDQAFPEFGGETIRSKFANEKRLYSEGADLRWCELSNVLTVNIVLISRDGYGLVQRRSKRGVSAAAQKLTGGVCENIHRFKDEADPINPLKRLNPLEGSSGQRIDYAYKPAGIPSPLLTAQRGVFEEVSPALYYEHVEGRAASTLVLGIIFDLLTFNPHVSGVIPLECSHDEILAYQRKQAGKDESEAERFVMLPLDVSDPLTKQYLSEPLDWVPAGLATFGFATQYWQERQRHRHTK